MDQQPWPGSRSSRSSGTLDSFEFPQRGDGEINIKTARLSFLVSDHASLASIEYPSWLSSLFVTCTTVYVASRAGRVLQRQFELVEFVYTPPDMDKHLHVHQQSSICCCSSPKNRADSADRYTVMLYLGFTSSLVQARNSDRALLFLIYASGS